MGSIRDPRRLPVYIDRVNNRLLADPQNGSAFFVVTPIGGGGSSPPGSLTQAGILQLEDSVTSTSVTKAATPNSVRQAFALAETANSTATGASANATQALNNSQEAVATANAISGTANQAVTAANNAVATANAAQATANSAASAVDAKLDKVGGTVTGDLLIGPAGRLGFEGATDNVFETYIAVADPTADRVITLPNADGTVALLETNNTWLGTQSFVSHVTFPSASCGNQLDIGAGGSIAFEGTVNDNFETFIYAANPTADRSIYFPDKTGTLAVLEDFSTVALTGSYNDLNARPTLGTAAALDVPNTGNASASQVVKGNDTRLSTSLGYTSSTRTLTSSTGGGVALPLVSSAVDGLAPASGGGASNFLRADGIWAVPPGTQGTDGDRGDITVSNGGDTWTIDNGVVTYAKLQATSTGNRILGKAGSLPGMIEEIPCTQAGRDLIAASDVAGQRTILGLGTLAQLDSLGNISSTGAVGSLAGLPLITTTGGVITTGSFGTAAGTFCAGNDSRLSNARSTPNSLTFSSGGNGAGTGTQFDGSVARVISYNSIGAAAEGHAHGSITNSGAIGTISGRPVVTGLNGVLTTGTFGTTSGSFCAGDDSRLSDRRLTVNTLTFTNAGGGAATGATFDGSAARTISYDTIGAAVSTHTHGSITNAGAIGSTSGLPIITGVGGVLQTGSFGNTAGTFCQGNDSRLTSSPTPNSITFATTGGAAAGSTFNGSSALTVSPATIGAAPTSNPTFSGTVAAAGIITTGTGISTGDCSIEVGFSRSGAGNAYVDLHANSGGDYNARLFRFSGTNGNLMLENAGTGDFYINTNGVTSFTANQGRIRLFGGGTSAGINVLGSGNITGSPNSSYFYANAAIKNDVSTSASIFASAVTTDTSASPVTLGELSHFAAVPGGTKGANTTITNQIGFIAGFNLTTGTNNFGFLGDINSANGRYNFYARGTAANYFTGTIASLGSYNATTASAANVNIDSFGNIQRSTSSIRYKKDVEPIDPEAVDRIVLGARSVWYRSTCESDNQTWSWYGLIAEEVAELDPRLVFWGRPTKQVLLREATEERLDSQGNVLEPAREATYTNATDEDAELRPEGVAYDRLTVVLLNFVQRQQEALDRLNASVQALQAKLAT